MWMKQDTCASKETSTNHECKVTYIHTLGYNFTVVCDSTIVSQAYGNMPISFLCKILRPLKRVSMILIRPNWKKNMLHAHHILCQTFWVLGLLEKIQSRMYRLFRHPYLIHPFIHNCFYLHPVPCMSYATNYSVLLSQPKYV